MVARARDVIPEIDARHSPAEGLEIFFARVLLARRSPFEYGERLCVHARAGRFGVRGSVRSEAPFAATMAYGSSRMTSRSRGRSGERPAPRLAAPESIR